MAELDDLLKNIYSDAPENRDTPADKRSPAQKGSASSVSLAGYVAPTAQRFDIPRIKDEPERAAAVPPAEPQKAKRTIRVGIISSALSLLVMGAALLSAILSGGDILQVVKLSPIILVFLGAEMLLNSFVHKDFRLKLSLGSIVLTLLLLLLCSGLCGLAVYGGVSGKERAMVQSRVSNDIRNDISSAVTSVGDVSLIEVQSTLNEKDLSQYKDGRDVLPTDALSVTITLGSIYLDKDAFSAHCRRILDTIVVSGYVFDDIVFVSSGETPMYTVTIHGRYQLGITSDEIAALL